MTSAKKVLKKPKKVLKKVKKFSSRCLIAFAWYFCVGFFNMPRPMDVNDIH